MRRFLAVPLFEIFTIACVGCLTLGVCLSVDGCRRVIEQRHEDREDRRWADDMADKEWKEWAANRLAKQRQHASVSPETVDR